ncbi:hypothetical protein [Leisingera sp. ANG-DT]|uniref:hypothetical protein n=1 Tax=Leisingera sp. ANG-DT TaxID=1577897 RepID=UPI00057F4819|nr:hypothetical protein [Leisingera sp. ANG-DT]KIC15788.1 hypothetical protein RA21_15145 [Leisingera sp. ANG-DT]
MATPAQRPPRPGSAAASALQQALVRLAQPGGTAGAEATDSLGAAVLREIRDTVLPREIILYIRQQPAAVLTVVHRRLAGIRLNGCTDPSTAAEDPEAAAQLFAARLRQLDAQARDQAFSFRRRPCAVPQGAGSCTAGTLAAALTAGGSSSRLDKFRAQAEVQAVAWLHCPRHSAQTQAGGSDALLTRLDAVRKALTSKSARPASARMPVPKPDCLLLPVTPQLHILAASDGGALLLLALPPEAARTLMAIWCSLYR